MRIKTYSEMIQLPTFEERFEYLKIGGAVGAATFGGSRYLNQNFYTSRIWKRVRNEIILRDEGRDLGIEGREIYGSKNITIHHINPITEDDIIEQGEFLLKPEFLICTSWQTHNAIHFGDINLLPQLPIERKPNDTSPWLNSRRV